MCVRLAADLADPVRRGDYQAWIDLEQFFPLIPRLYEQADRVDREEAYGDFVDAVETATEALADMRDRFARTLDEDAVETYEDSFNRAVRKRWPELGLEIENR